MTKYRVFDQAGKPVGYTTSLTELNQFMATHPGYTRESQEVGSIPLGQPSTLPKIQEDRPAPKGEKLEQ